MLSKNRPRPEILYFEDPKHNHSATMIKVKVKKADVEN